MRRFNLKLLVFLLTSWECELGQELNGKALETDIAIWYLLDRRTWSERALISREGLACKAISPLLIEWSWESTLRKNIELGGDNSSDLLGLLDRVTNQDLKQGVRSATYIKNNLTSQFLLKWWELFLTIGSQLLSQIKVSPFQIFFHNEKQHQTENLPEYEQEQNVHSHCSAQETRNISTKQIGLNIVKSQREGFR